MTLFTATARALRAFTLLGCFAATFALSACSEYKAINKSVKESEARSQAALSKIEPTQTVAEPLTIDKTPWFGSEAKQIVNGAPLPDKFEQANAVVVTFPGAVTVEELAQLLQGVTGMRVITAQSTGSSSTGSADNVKRFLPGDGEVVTGGRVVWQGRLSALLNQASDFFGGDWSYDGHAIRLATEVTRTFMLHALATSIDTEGELKQDSSSGGSSSSASAPTGSLKSTVALKVWDEIKEAVTSIVGSAGRATFSPSTGTITVSGSPDTVRRVESYLNQQNAMRLRRISVAVSVLNVTIGNTLAINTSATDLIKTVFKKNGLRVTGEKGNGLSFTLQDNTAATATAENVATTLNATEGIERAAITHSGAVVTLSDQPAPLMVGRQISYLSRVSSTTDSSGATSVSLEPGQVNVGLMMNVLPRIVDANRVLLRLNMSVSSTSQPFPSFSSSDGKTRIDLPEIESTGFLQNAVLTSGETLVLAGYERDANSAANDGTPGGTLIGAKRSTERRREMTVLLLRSEILPEDPITVIGR